MRAFTISITMAHYYLTADLSALALGPSVKEDRVYVAPLDPPLLVQTPPVTLLSSLGGDDDGGATFALLDTAGPFLDFVRAAEAAVIEAVVAKRAELFRKDMDPDALRANFKSFVSDAGVLRVKVADDLVVFDASQRAVGHEEASEGARVRCVLELSRVCFGRAEFGAVWRLKQVQGVPGGPCLLTEEAPGAVASEEEDLADAVDDYV